MPARQMHLDGHTNMYRPTYTLFLKLKSRSRTRSAWCCVLLCVDRVVYGLCATPSKVMGAILQSAVGSRLPAVAYTAYTPLYTSSLCVNRPNVYAIRCSMFSMYAFVCFLVRRERATTNNTIYIHTYIRWRNRAGECQATTRGKE